MLKKKKSVDGKVGVAVAAAVIGAAAGAAAVALSDKNNRKKLKQTLDDAKVKGGKLVKNAQKQLDNHSDIIGKKANEIKRDVRKEVKFEVKKNKENAKKEITKELNK